MRAIDSIRVDARMHQYVEEARLKRESCQNDAMREF